MIFQATSKPREGVPGHVLLLRDAGLEDKPAAAAYWLEGLTPLQALVGVVQVETHVESARFQRLKSN